MVFPARSKSRRPSSSSSALMCPLPGGWLRGTASAAREKLFSSTILQNTSSACKSITQLPSTNFQSPMAITSGSRGPSSPQETHGAAGPRPLLDIGNWQLDIVSNGGGGGGEVLVEGQVLADLRAQGELPGHLGLAGPPQAVPEHRVPDEALGPSREAVFVGEEQAVHAVFD